MAAISIFFYFFLFFASSEAKINGSLGNGFTTTLVRRDSLLPRYDRLINSFRRSFYRYATLLEQTTTISIPTTTGAHAPLIPNKENGEFVMSISIGTPPVDFVAIIDTGSVLTWTQCLPCIRCFNQSVPIFDPRHSSTYRLVNCTSRTCRSLDDSGCGENRKTCNYGYYYNDKSFTYGELAFEKITIGSFKLHKTVIGCGHENGGTFKGSTTGIIGLGRGSLSFVSQMRKINVKQQFSYCLPTFFSEANITGRIYFGRNAVVSGHEVISTNFVSKSSNPFYYITLEAISIGNKQLKAVDNMSTVIKKGNMFIDSGTTLTFLPPNLYDSIVSTLVNVVPGKRVADPSGILKVCYAAANVDDLDIPIITMHFSGGAAVKLPPMNTFITVAPNVTCLTFAKSLDDSAVFGNLAQVNFLIGYDLEQNKLSFKRTVCA